MLGVAAGLLAVVLLAVLLSGGSDEAAGPGQAVEDLPDVPQPETPRGGGGRRVAAAIGPSSLQFTASLAGRSRPQFVRAENRGGGRIVLGRVRLEGRDRRDFVRTDGCSGTALRGGESCTVAVSFVPKRRRGKPATGRRSAALVFTDDGVRGRRTVSLTGSAVPR